MRITTALATFSFLLPIFTHAADPNEWTMVGSYNGVDIFRRASEVDGMIAYKARGTLDAPMAKLVTLVTDTANRSKWMERLVASDVVEQVSPMERIEYIRGKAVWPVKDRDFVYRAKMGIDAPSKTVTFEAHSVEDPRVPPLSGVVRGQIHFAKFTMTGLDEGKKTHVEMESLTDPRGALPKWIVNFFQKIVMRKWMDVMLKIVARPDIPPSPLVKDFFPPADGRH